MAAAEKHGISMIDLVVVNLYPFEATVSRPGVTLEEAIENIDIGGPSMVRSAAKNFSAVAIICNPARYDAVLAELRRSGGELSPETRARLAVEAFSHTAAYDAMIANYLGQHLGGAEEVFPEKLTRSWARVSSLRYGENPHQQAALYREPGYAGPSLVAASQLHGKELSYNNYLDLESALKLVIEFADPAAAVIKHNTPCGAAVAPALRQAFEDALACDPLSAMGGIIALNRRVEAETAEAIRAAGFMECVVAPGYEDAALEILRRKRDFRVLAMDPFPSGPMAGLDFRLVAGGLLAQQTDTAQLGADLKTVTKRSPTADELASLRFGWVVAKHVKSNAIVLTQGTRTVGLGGGQTSRVDAVTIAARKAGDRARGAALASDAFFPKADGVEAAAAAGVVAIMQPGGSLGDAEVIAASDRAGVAMVFTGRRHFRH
jgi:phosphoribosylaminoimidazolecarboxamide formyltransferase/IMP cyclohydrolase